MEIDLVLSELSKLLYGYNYEVFLRLYKIPYLMGATTERYVTEALGEGAVIGGSVPITGQEVLAEVEGALRHVGDQGYGPLPAALGSKRFNDMLDMVLSHITQATTSAFLIEQFWLKEGHPGYPVYWDFAFVIGGTGGGEVFIGSSSD